MERWPIVITCCAMILAAIIDWWKYKVPNWLTYSIILSGWALGLAHDLGLPIDGYRNEDGQLVTGVGGFGAALLGTIIGLALLYPVYFIGGMGAGDVKMQMGFGSWMGAYFGINVAVNIIPISFCAGVLVGGVIGAVMILLRGEFRKNLQNAREIVQDVLLLLNTGQYEKMKQRAQERRPRWHRLPYGVPLCIGFVGYLVYFHT